MSLNARVDEGFLESLHQFAEAARRAEVDWLIVGATARQLLLEGVYNWPEARATEDTDFAVWVEDWAHFDRLCRACTDSRHFEPLAKPPKRFRAVGGRYFDLLPYGGLEESGNKVLWPPHGDFLMTVRGFRGAARKACLVTVNERLDVPVVSPDGLLALKLFAWEERGRQGAGADAADIAYLLTNAERLAGVDEIYEQHPELASLNDYDLHLAAVSVLGVKSGSLLDSDETDFLLRFLEQEVGADLDSDLVRDLSRYVGFGQTDRIHRMVAALRAGVLRAADE